MKSFEIADKQSGMRLNRFVQSVCPLLPASGMYKYLRLKRIKVNGKRADASYRLACGDTVELYINDEFFTPVKRNYDFMGAKKALTVEYEDQNIAVLYKPAGVLVHSDDNSERDTLINRFLRYLHEKGEYTPERGGFVPALCNRIDRGTFGLVIAAKNREVLTEMNEIIKRRLAHKSYLCAVTGTPPADGEYTAYLFKDENANRVTVRLTPAEGYKTIITGTRLLKQNNGLSLLDVDLVTGRTHQIRAHLAFLGCPIVGDGKYGDGRVNRGMGLERQALCAYKIRFSAPKEDFPLLCGLDGVQVTLSDVWFVEEYFG